MLLRSLTKRFMDWYQGNNDKEKETPAGGIERVGYVLWNYVGGTGCGEYAVSFMLYSYSDYSRCSWRLEIVIFWEFTAVGYGFSLEDYWKEFKSGNS